MAVTESKHDEDHPIIEIHDDYIWICKNRVNGSGDGVRLLISTNSISVNDDNFLE